MNFNNQNLDDLIKLASAKSGVDANKLKGNVENGKLDSLIAKMKPQDAQKLQQILNNPQLAQQMLNTPQAQALVKKFMQN